MVGALDGGSSMKMRGIKPDFWTDEDLVTVSPFARLLFIGLWHMACDNGHVKDSPKRIKMSILPADDVNVPALLDELAEVGVIVRQARWITVPNLGKHQRLDRRYFLTCDHDSCSKPSGKAAEDDENPAPNPTGTRRAHDVDTTGPRDEGEGEGEGEVVRARRARTNAPSNWEPNAHHAQLANEAGIDLRTEATQFLDFHASKANKFADWDRAFNTWLRNAKKWKKPIGGGGRVSHVNRDGTHTEEDIWE